MAEGTRWGATSEADAVRSSAIHDANQAERGRGLALRLGGFAMVSGVLLILAGFLGFDRWFYETVSVRLNTPGSDVDPDFYLRTRILWDLARVFSNVVGVSLAVVFVLWLHPRGWRAAVELAGWVVLAALLAAALQSVLGRARPNLSGFATDFSPGLAGLILRDARGGFGFPSGEAATAGALAAVLARFFPRAAMIFWSLAALAACARWAPGMHYFSDVAAGLLLGGLIGSRAQSVPRQRSMSAGDRTAGAPATALPSSQ